MSIRWTVGATCLLMITTGCATARNGLSNIAATAPSNHIGTHSTLNLGLKTLGNTMSTNGADTPLFTAIQRYYPAHGERILHTYQTENGVLIEWNFGDPHIASRYTWWDAQNGQQINLPSTTDFTKVLSASSTNVTLVTLGPNSIDDSLTFPYIIEDSREANQDVFQTEKRPYYLLLAHDVEFGGHKTCAITSLLPTVDGFEVSFGPDPTNKVAFYADGTGWPRMKTSYNSQNHTFTIRFLNTVVSGTVRSSTSSLKNEFVASAKALQSGSDTLLQFDLTPACTNYNGQCAFLYDQLLNPYVTFHFAGHALSYYPMTEEQPR